MVNYVKNSKLIKTPVYFKKFYAKFYDNEKLVHFLDNPRVLYFLTLGVYPKLVNDVVKEVCVNGNVVQFGCTFGNQIEAVSNKIGVYGDYTILDISQKQINRCQNKDFYHRNHYELYDVRRLFDSGQKYDAIICFMLLHELPQNSRIKVVNNALQSVTVGGKVVFIDYNKPSKYNPFWWFIRMFNRLYQPFAEDLWKNSIQSYALNGKNFTWRKKIYRGGTYQKVVATRRK